MITTAKITVGLLGLALLALAAAGFEFPEVFGHVAAIAVGAAGAGMAYWSVRS